MAMYSPLKFFARAFPRPARRSALFDAVRPTSPVRHYVSAVSAAAVIAGCVQSPVKR